MAQHRSAKFKKQRKVIAGNASVAEMHIDVTPPKHNANAQESDNTNHNAVIPILHPGPLALTNHTDWIQVSGALRTWDFQSQKWDP